MMTAPPKLQHVLDCLVELAPPHLAASWDNVGLMVGDPDTPLAGVVIAVDPTLEAVEETIRLGANLLITHHPLLFKAPKSLDLRREPGRTIARLIQSGVGLYAAHTNLDVTAVNVALAGAIGLEGVKVLDVTGSHPTYKLAVYVPISEGVRVREAAWDAGAGKSDSYDQGAYALEATGTFRPLPGARPAEGKIGAQTTTHETRLEFVVSSQQLKAVKAAISKAHPYEEPAFDVIELYGAGEPYGFGLVGDLTRPETLQSFARRIKRTLGANTVRIVGDPERTLHRIAWLGGSGGDYWPKAQAAGCDTYITGEVRHHAALDALAAGMSFVEIGHVGSEQPVVPYLASYLQEKLGAGVRVHSLVQQDPFTVI